MTVPIWAQDDDYWLWAPWISGYVHVQVGPRETLAYQLVRADVVEGDGNSFRISSVPTTTQIGGKEHRNELGRCRGPAGANRPYRSSQSSWQPRGA